jgi:hypothetical protein
MAFTTANLLNVYSGPQGYGIYLYKSDTDARAVVEAAGYFNNDDDNQVLAVDDMVTVIGDEGGYSLYVSSLSSGAVSTGSVSGASSVPLAAGSTLTLTKLAHDGRTIAWDTAAGSVVTLPAATGTGMKFRFVVTTLATSNGHEVKCVGTDEFVGHCSIIDVDTADATISFAAQAADDFDRILFARSTTGLATPGDWVEVEDIVTGSWAIKGSAVATGTVATPFIST